MSKKPFINTHTHIFTDKNIAPDIAKTFIPWPFYKILNIRFVFVLFKAYKWMKKIFKNFKKNQNKFLASYRTTPIIRELDKVLSVFITASVVSYIIRWSGNSLFNGYLDKSLDFLSNNGMDFLVFRNIPLQGKLLFIGTLLFLYPKISGYLLGLAKKLIGALKVLPSKNMLKFIQRYLTIAEFAKYKTQKNIFDRLIKMYEPGSKVVVLPMDMEYMKAGSPKQSYLDQLEELKEVIDNDQTNVDALIPFLFVDPRRIRNENKDKVKQPFFDWEMADKEVDGNIVKQVKLKQCVVRDCLEGNSDDGSMNGYFKGIKLYPALGYYPFDHDLLPLYAYCVQNNIPITTHCIEGSIFYRGRIQKEWMHHPVFKNNKGIPLSTPAKTNFELQINFTHPMNYLVLLEEELLADHIRESNDSKIKTLFGYSDKDHSIQQNLSSLKVNLAHYGGKDEWMRYLEGDRKNASVELIEKPAVGMNLIQPITPKKNAINLNSVPSFHMENNTEWFTIISTMMLQYENVYADISYILHSEEVKPLLYEILHKNEKLSKKILFGTDFFVVRNHKSEKELYADLFSFIGEDKMDLIARENPDRFLQLREKS